MNILENYIAYHLTLPKVDVTAYVWDIYIPKNTYFDVFNEGNLFVHTYVTNGSFHVVMPAINGQINYTQKDFMFSCEYNTPESTLMNSGRIIRSPASYDLNVGYTFKGANRSTKSLV